MIKNINVHSEKKLVKDLTLHELNIIYSLVRIGDWADSEIGRVYKLSEEDVRRVFDNYVDLLEAAEKNPPVQDQPREDPSQESVENPRKRRSDAQYATPAERQAAYRVRLKESRRVSLEQQSPTVDMYTPIPVVEEPSVMVCEALVPEIAPENAKAQYLNADAEIRLSLWNLIPAPRNT